MVSNFYKPYLTHRNRLGKIKNTCAVNYYHTKFLDQKITECSIYNTNLFNFSFGYDWSTFITGNRNSFLLRICVCVYHKTSFSTCCRTGDGNVKKKKKVNTHSNYFLLSNLFFRSRLTWAGNAVIPAPVWQDIGVTPKLLRLFVCSNNNSNLCSHPRLLANLPSQFQL